MGFSNQFYGVIGVDGTRGKGLAVVAKAIGISIEQLKYYNNNNILPSGNDLIKIINYTGLSEIELKLKLGRLDSSLISAIQSNYDKIYNLIKNDIKKEQLSDEECILEYETSYGKMYRGDCIKLLSTIDNDIFDMIFADPPFNLNKIYESNIDDKLKTEKYISWCHEWLQECIRTLKPGGSLLLWNLPKWNTSLANFLEGRMTFRHSISVDIKYSLPISGRLYPSNYSLLYYVKGPKPNTFHPDRLSMQVCKYCYHDIKDYGGYKDKMNPLGVNLSDVWTDIPPVRHAKYKRRQGANELSLKLLDRVIEMSTNPGDIIFDPFGGSGTTYMAAELKGRRWLGCELGPVDDIVERFKMIDEEREILNSYRENLNKLFPEKISDKRQQLGLWTDKTFCIK